MIENVASLSGNSKVKPIENDYKLGQRESSQGSQNSSLNKFLKRKPDTKKILMGPSSRKKKDNSISDYFAMASQISHDHQIQTVSDVRFHTSRFINKKHEMNEDQKSKQDQESLMLESAKSQNNIFARRNEIGLLTNRKTENQNKFMKESILSKDSKQSTRHMNQKEISTDKMGEYSHFGYHQRGASKKSKTQFFNFEQLRGLSDQSSDIFSKMDANELNSTRQCGDLSQQYQKLRCQCESLTKKSRLLQEQIDLCNERNYLLATEKKHLEEMLKEKDKIIDRMQREKSLFKLKGKSQIEQIQKYKEEVKSLKLQMAKVEQRNNALSEQTKEMQNEINAKNEQLILVYDQYTELQSKYLKQQQEMSQKLQKMKQDINGAKKHDNLKQDLLDLNKINEFERWRQRIFKQQEQIKYLQIQNQCLMISKEQLCRCQGQNRKLRDQRDYFKKKIMENIKKNNRTTRDFSRSDNASIILELSDLSIDRN